jgi:hypothetical protein
MDISRRLESKHYWNLSEEQEEGTTSVVSTKVVAALSPRHSSHDNKSRGRGRSSGEAAAPDIILSLKDANYKSIMFSFFRKLGADASDKRDPDKEKVVKDEVYDLFKNSGGKLMVYEGKGSKAGLIEVDEKTARNSKCDVLVFLAMCLFVRIIRGLKHFTLFYALRRNCNGYLQEIRIATPLE